MMNCDFSGSRMELIFPDSEKPEYTKTSVSGAVGRGRWPPSAAPRGDLRTDVERSRGAEDEEYRQDDEGDPLPPDREQRKGPGCEQHQRRHRWQEIALGVHADTAHEPFHIQHQRGEEEPKAEELQEYLGETIGLRAEESSGRWRYEPTR